MEQEFLTAVGKDERGSLELPANPIDAVDHFRPSDQFALQRVPSGKIDQAQSEDNRQDALPRPNQHNNSEDHQYDAEKIFKNAESPPHHGRLFVQPPGLSIVHQIIFRQPHDREWNADRCQYQHDARTDRNPHQHLV